MALTTPGNFTTLKTAVPAPTNKIVSEAPITNFLNTAIQYHQAGLICMPVKETKGPNLPSYADYHKVAATLEKIKAWPWTSPYTHGVGIFTGRPSGDLVVLDFDLKYDNTGDLFTRWMELIPDEMKRLFVIAETRSGGYHIYYRCIGTDTKSVKLAQRHTTFTEKEKNPHEKQKVLIETRGIGGIIVCAPTPGYQWIQGDQSTIPVFTLEKEAWLLQTCRSFNEVFTVFQPTFRDNSFQILSSELSPTEDYDNKADVSGLLQSHGWEFVKSHGAKDHYKRPGDTGAATSGNYDHDLKWFSVFSTSTQFETNKAYRPWMVYAVLEHNGDFKVAYRSLKDKGFGAFKRYDTDVLRKLRGYLVEGKEGDAMQYMDVIFEDKTLRDAYLEKAKEPVFKVENSFWYFNDKNKLIIGSAQIMDFITRAGFWKHYTTGNINPIPIRIVDSIATQVNISIIIDFVSSYILSLPFEFDGIYRDQLFNKVFDSSSTYFSEIKLNWLQPNEREFLMDSADTAYVFFSNCVVTVTPGEFHTGNYSCLKDNIVWDNQVKRFSFEKDSTTISDFSRFMWQISAQDNGRYLTNLKILGYLMHRYKNPSATYAIIACEDTETVELGGGTGKSLIGVALGKIVPATTIDGKGFDIKKTFAWQSYSIGDSLVILDDLDKKFSIEHINTIITGGLIVEKKNKDAITIPFEDSPKFFATTNYVVDESAVSSKRRIRKLIVAPYFSIDRSPQDEFKKLFFVDWDTEGWNAFYNFMLTNICFFLKDPNIEALESVNLIKKQFTSKYGNEILDFLANASTLDTYRDKKSVKDYWYHNFLIFSGQETQRYSLKLFSMALKEASAQADLFPSLLNCKEHNISTYMFTSGPIGINRDQ